MSRNPDINEALTAAGYVKPAKPPVVTVPGRPGLSTVAMPGNPMAQRYADQACQREADAVAATGEGGRNHQLNTSAFKLGTLVGAGLLAAQHVYDVLTAAGMAAGLPEPEARQTVTSGLKAGMLHPREVILTSGGITAGVELDMGAPDADAPVSGAPPWEAGSLDTGYITTESLVDGYVPVDWFIAWERSTDDVPWLVHPLFERGRVYALYSAAKVGKSLVMHDICAALASGRSCLGNATEPAQDIMYVDFENSETDLVDRFTDFGYGPGDLKRLHYFTYPALPALDSMVGGLHLVALAEKFKPVMVVIDTTSRVIQGKENDSDTFHALYRHAMMPLKAMGITVVRLDHSGKDDEKGMRGSSAKVTDVDGAWKLTQVGDTLFQLQLTAQRASHSPQSVTLERVTEPYLRHVIRNEDGSTDIDMAVHDLVATMDRTNMPVEYGDKRAKAWLRERHIKFTNSNLTSALRIRRAVL